MIGVFDSGIGGVTVLKELLKELPFEDFYYLSDSKNNPYGDKSNDEIIKLSDENVKFLIDKGAKVIVIACNTASAIAKDYLRSKYSIPIIAIEPAYKVVYDENKNHKTVVMATHATINSDKFKELYHKYDNHDTILLECSGLADLIEENDKDKIIDYLKDKFKGLDNIENVVLGCTHYPIIKEKIKSVLGNVNFYDGSKGVAKQTKKILDENNLLKKDGKGSLVFFDTDNNEEKSKFFYEYLGVIK